MEDTLLRIENLNKSFGITHANRNINLTLGHGEIRGLAGENGSGKSTLLSQVAGLLPHDSGSMYINGAEYAPRNPVDANKRKIAMVVQELGMVGSLPASVNVYLGKTKPFIHMKKLQQDADQVSDRWGLPRLNLRKMAGAMNVENRKMVEVLRALSCDPELLILDELTQSLSHDNRELIYTLIQRMKKENRSVILISHDLEETLRITDTISVLRDGELLETLVSRDTTEEELKRKMVGRRLDGEYYRADWEEQYQAEVVFSMKNISTSSGLKNIDLELHRGEILAFCGLSDSGIHDLGKVAYGIMPSTAGEVYLNCTKQVIRTAKDARKAGMAYVPKDRDGEAMMMKASIWNNIVLPSLEEKAGPFGFLNYRQLREMAEECRRQFRIKCTGIDQNVSGLSGGNKQKVNLSRWLIKDPVVLVVDCPTRGVDVGVKAYIYQCLREAKKRGMGILMITDELSEAKGMADHIIVMKHGEIKKKIARSTHFSEEEMIEVMV
ncbi:MAG: sugar ABC transporter ATP-binding protein [Lachnospiraceae bacterium]|nr:sugar ABC transporter ATP-binding protein [Lachnospiraceae bacterium]